MCLNTDARARDREKFDEWVAAQEREKMMAPAAEEKRKEEEEEVRTMVNTEMRLQHSQTQGMA